MTAKGNDINSLKSAFQDSGFDKELIQKYTGTVEIRWTPNWVATKKTITNDTLQYIYVPLDGEFFNTENKTAKRLSLVNTDKYLLCKVTKNKTQFLLATYMITGTKVTGSNSIKSKVEYADHYTNFKTLNGTLLLKDFQTQKSYVYKYQNGVNQTLQQSKLSHIKTNGYEEVNCTYYQVCTWVANEGDVEYCGLGGVGYEQTNGEYCAEPDNIAHGGCYVSWNLVSTTVEKVCDYIYVPDPPDNGGGGGAGGNSNEDAISNELTVNDKFLIDCDSLTLLKIAAYASYGDMYQQVASFTPSQSILNRIQSMNDELNDGSFGYFDLQQLENATGPIVNSDFFPVKITSLPTGTNMATLTEYFRKNLNTFITPGLANFSPYVDQNVNDTQLYNQTGSQSVGALVHIQMANDGTVVESDYHSDVSGTYYKFSTMSSPLDFNHPVSGNREFGIYADPSHPGQYTFYTMGVDRTSDWMFATVNSFNAVFNGADELWKDMQNHMIDYINTHGGRAEFYSQRSYTARPNYNTVKDYLNGTITLDELKHKIGCQ